VIVEAGKMVRTPFVPVLFMNFKYFFLLRDGLKMLSSTSPPQLKCYWPVFLMGSLQNGSVYISIFHLMLTVVVTAILRSSDLYKLYTYKSVESHTASAAVDQFRRDSVLHCSISVSTEIVTKTSGEFSFDFYSTLFVLNQSFK